jgi:hypothetical protein
LSYSRKLAGVTVWPPRATIFNPDGSPRLHRYYLVGSGNTFGVFVHHFVASDEEWRMHNHPWRWAFALVLAGGYREWRLGADGRQRSRWLGRGRVNLVGGFHRVELAGRPAWTLFVHGPKIRRWGFLNLMTRVFALWSPAQELR